MALKKQLLGIGVLALLISGCGGGSGVLAPPVNVSIDVSGLAMDVTLTVDATTQTVTSKVPSTPTDITATFIIPAGAGSSTIKYIKVQPVTASGKYPFAEARSITTSIALPGGYVCSDGTSAASCPVNKRNPQRITGVTAKILGTQLLPQSVRDDIANSCTINGCTNVVLQMDFVVEGEAGQSTTVTTFSEEVPTLVIK